MSIFRALDDIHAGKWHTQPSTYYALRPFQFLCIPQKF